MTASGAPAGLGFFDARPLEQAVEHTSMPIAEDDHVLVSAPLAATAQIFTENELFDAIRRDPDPRDANACVAAVSMTFHYASSACQMTLHITSDKVNHLARELFGIRLETKDGLRYVCAGGSKILPNPMFTFQGCPRTVIQSTFGAEVSRAIQASPPYQDDARQWRRTTDAVSMVISHEGDVGAAICLRLGLYEGTQIKQKLYV